MMQGPMSKPCFPPRCPFQMHFALAFIYGYDKKGVCYYNLIAQRKRDSKTPKA